MEDLDFVTRLKRSGQTADAAEPFRNRYFAAARLPRFSGPLGRSILKRVSRAVAGPPTDRGCEAAIQEAAARRRIRRPDQGYAVGDESALRNRKFESTSLQRRVLANLTRSIRSPKILPSELRAAEMPRDQKASLDSVSYLSGRGTERSNPASSASEADASHRT